jgi:hypothetical protein
MAGIWGALPGDSPRELEWSTGLHDGGMIHELAGMASAFATHCAPEENARYREETLQSLVIKQPMH